jgi:ABC-type sulfate transport system permease subunit
MENDPYESGQDRRLRAHELHIKYIYGIRLGGLALSAVAIIVGAVMVFRGLQGSFNWAIEAPNSIGAKLTNASPGIVFATVGLIIAFIVINQKPVNFDTDDNAQSITIGVPPNKRKARR